MAFKKTKDDPEALSSKTVEGTQNPLQNPLFGNNEIHSHTSREALRPNVWVDSQFKVALAALYASVAVDVLVNAFTDPLHSEDTNLHLLVFCLQLMTFLGSSIIFYILLSETFLIKKALYRRVVEEFQFFFFLYPVYFFTLLVLRFYRLALVYSFYPDLAVWDQPGYYAMFCIQKLGALAYWGTLVSGANYLMWEPRLYTADSVTRLE
mmetsp:Transcript_32612/g.45252  ORF Transcript_32612/g.45252 Transcript_32612/m.45252 type:complete len:208 (-) Transcript_32612:104-727(-)|eukprot:CAMPEP_0196593466 /NCGR_PEP_ID=MMETSP1081-20130531/75713_1 /TAXON_ID=36882 /ORGANISM="Pyramimonas amylifera, Strain CCMP720" /LENGTH=207 /DNA_ID=CAMNT_0041917457 /DNA_START=281 /DNA_END=904 /DNA_ORIENTATION=-